MANKHAKYGGSAIHRGILCSKSWSMIAALGKRKSGDAAQRGTDIHKYLEMYMTGNFASQKKKLKGKELEYATIASVAGNKIKELAAELGFTPAECNVEKNRPLPRYPELAGGTPDYDAYRSFHDIWVVDLKTGNNYVEAEDNWQGLFYLCCIFFALDPFTQQSIRQAHFTIVQPSAEPPYDCRVQTWTFPIEKLIEAYEIICAAIDAAENNPTFNPGDHCESKYCDARATCPAYQEWKNSESAGILERAVFGQPDPAKWTLAQILKAEEVLTPLFKSAKESALASLQADPTSVPGYGVSQGYGHRKWKSESAAEAWAKTIGLKIDEYKPRSFVAPPDMERILKAKEIKADLPECEQPLTKPSVKPVKPDASDMIQQFAPSQDPGVVADLTRLL